MSGNGAVCGLHTPPPIVDKNSGNDDGVVVPLPLLPCLYPLPQPVSPSHPPFVASSLAQFAVTWHWGLGSLSSSLAGDDVAAGRWAVTQKGGWWWASGDVVVRMVVVGIEWGVGIERGGDVAACDSLGKSLLFPPFKLTSFPPHLCNFFKNT